MIQRAHIAIRGAVQGVGFRPFVYRLACEMGVAGWVSNGPHGVCIEAQGDKDTLDRFVRRLETERPPRASIQSLECSFLDPLRFESFTIRPSDSTGGATTLVMPDIATCADCLNEILEPGNRRFRYPFTNCTQCGPRYTIIESLPYDRNRTSMKHFEMCPECRQEYDDPTDRRFHAQPNACPACGPQLRFLLPDGKILQEGDGALIEAAEAVRSGKVVAIKGLGGFHLMVDAHNEIAVRRLRTRKHREEKPLALMYPSLDEVRRDCTVSHLEERLLLSPECPIVLLGRGAACSVAPSVAPGNPSLGVMLPYTPLHHLLMADLGYPVVATSGNLSEEPICTDELDALARLQDIADAYLVHNRPIVRHVDDSIARVLLGREMMLRRARGYAPLPITLTETAPGVLALGGHLKNTVALTVGNNAFLSQHIGDLESEAAFGAFERAVADLKQLFLAVPETVAVDMHPDYASTRFGRSIGTRAISVQHHHAHVLACMAENRLRGPVLGISWDGTGYGVDGRIWGGEFLRIDQTGFERVGSLREFRLPGGSRAIREPWRAALGLVHGVFPGTLELLAQLPSFGAFVQRSESRVLLQMLDRQVNAPLTSSAGRLFDAVASLAGIRHSVSFEGQAAMELEFALDEAESAAYPFDLCTGPGNGDSRQFLVDWHPLVRALVDDRRSGAGPGLVSARFHNAMVEIIVAAAQRVGLERVVLSGGCFQNRYLLERSVRALEAEGLRPYWHQRVPPNDGGLALGQAVAAAGRRSGTNMKNISGDADSRASTRIRTQGAGYVPGRAG